MSCPFKAHRLTVRRNSFREEEFHNDVIGLARKHGMNLAKINFCFDEVYPNFQPVFAAVRKFYPDAEIWAAGIDDRNAHEDLRVERMTKVLRCPPTVQTVLKTTNCMGEKHAYYVDSGARQGLPAEGPKPKYIFHSDHCPFSDGLTSLKCKRCAEEILRFFQETLDLGSTAKGSDSSTFAIQENSQGLSQGSPVFSKGSPVSSKNSPVSSKGSPVPCKGSPAQSSNSPVSSKGSPILSDDSPHAKCSPKKNEVTSSNVLLNTATPKRLTLRDVVLLCNPAEKDGIYVEGENELYRLDQSKFNSFVNLIDQSVMVKTLREKNYQVRTVKDTSSEDLAWSSQDAITASWVNLASGLEWAVVIYAPGDPRKQEIRSSTPVSEIRPHKVMDEEPMEIISQSGKSDDALRHSTKNVSEESTKMPSSSHETTERDNLKPSFHGSADNSIKEGALLISRPSFEDDLSRMEKMMSRWDRDYLFWAASRCTSQLIVLVP